MGSCCVTLEMLDFIVRAIVAFGLLSIPWLHAYLPVETVWGVVLLGTVCWGAALGRSASLSIRLRWGIVCLLVFVGLQACSLLNRGAVDPGDGFPDAGRLTVALSAWLPGTVAWLASVRWLAWWWGLTGLVAWWVSARDRGPRPPSLWLWGLFLGAVFSMTAGLAGKAGYILPGFSAHHGVFQPFPYRNHGVAYAVLGMCSGLALAVRLWPKQRVVAFVLAVASIAALGALPWSQSRFAFVPQLVIAAGLLFLVTRALLPQWQRALGRKRSKALFAVLAGVGLVTVWLAGDFTGRMRDTRRQFDLVLSGEYPDLRLPSAGAALEAGWSRFPWGWGGGSFPAILPLFAGDSFYAEIYQPETNNFGRLIPSPAAHNDWAEWWSEFGAIGLGLLFAGLMLLRTPCERASGTERTLLMLGAVVLLVFSCFDYPLHSPPVLFAGVAYWVGRRF